MRGWRPPLVRLQNVVAGGGSDDGQRKRRPEAGGAGRRRKKSERYGREGGRAAKGVDFRVHPRGEPASGRRQGRAGREFTSTTEFLQDPVSHELTHQRVYTRQTHSWIKSGRARDSKGQPIGIFLNSVLVPNREGSTKFPKTWQKEFSFFIVFVEY